MLIYSVLKLLEEADVLTFDQLKTAAASEIQKVETGQANAQLKKYIEIQDTIFNSLEFNQ